MAIKSDKKPFMLSDMGDNPTAGGADQDLERLGYKRIKRPMFPFDKYMIDPDLNVRWIPESGSDEEYN